MTQTERAALIRADSCADPRLSEKIGAILDAVLNARRGMNVLVKPNLLMASPLACTSPEVVKCACAWLLDQGCKVAIADSPAFGTARSVATAIGLAEALKPLGLEVENFRDPQKTRLKLEPCNPAVALGRQALECDLILSVPRVKAHSQMRITLAVKNCFGCVHGPAKALAHMKFGRSATDFAEMLAAVFTALPPVAALCDGITAMSRTGPRNGDPFQLGLLCASASAPCADLAIMRILGLDPDSVPLHNALGLRGLCPEPVFPLAGPDEFNAHGFKVPEKLKDVSFNPLRLSFSLVKRLLLGLGGRR